MQVREGVQDKDGKVNYFVLYKTTKVNLEKY